MPDGHVGLILDVGALVRLAASNGIQHSDERLLDISLGQN
jgi:hypothetical protein